MSLDDPHDNIDGIPQQPPKVTVCERCLQSVGECECGNSDPFGIIMTLALSVMLTLLAIVIGCIVVLLI